MRERFTSAIFDIIDIHLEYNIGFYIICNTNDLKCDNEEIFKELKNRFPEKITLSINNECLFSENYEWDYTEDDKRILIFNLPFGEETAQFTFEGSEINAVMSLEGAPLVVRPLAKTRHSSETQNISDAEENRNKFIEAVKEQLGDQPLKKLAESDDTEKENMVRSLDSFAKNNPNMKIKR